MRFILDHDVDAAVVDVIRSAAHEATTAAQVGLETADDADLAVWADDRSYVVISHDRAFAAWRKRKTWGRHVYLRCSEPQAVTAVERFLSDIIGVLERRPDVVVTVQLTRYEVAPMSW